jgi:hypothetical protein
MIAVANEPAELGLLQSVWSGPARPNPAPLLRYLIAVGLVTGENGELNYGNPALTCHELVRERIYAWIRNHPQDQDGLSENSIRLGYAERLAAVLKTLQNRNMTAALQAGSRALVYCVQAEDYDRLADFASNVVSSASDTRLLLGLLPVPIEKFVFLSFHTLTDIQC